jgi:acetyltransferase-like isoleucine patch superfamily enzyme/V8-like Glu-specific endopeptidase
VSDWLVSEEVPTSDVIMAEPDAGALAASRLQDEPRYKVGISVPVYAVIDPGTANPAAGTIRWRAGGFVWTAVLESPGASSLKLGFADLDLPEGVELYLYNDKGQVDGPYTGTGRPGHSAFFARAMHADRVYLQLRYDGADIAETLDRIAFTITEVAHLDERFLISRAANPAKEHCSNLNEPCVENAECDLHDPADDAVVDDLRQATGHMLFQSGFSWYVCSGGLIESLDGTPGHFLTANHCIATVAEAASLETYFNFTTPCPSGGGPTTTCDYADGTNSISPSIFGATIVDTSNVTDFTLLKLEGAPPVGTTHLPFSTTPIASAHGSQLHRISHPNGAPQAYSLHRVDANWDLCGEEGDFIYSEDLIGATEGGSSGSPVVNDAGEIVGQLYGACGLNTNDDCDSVNNRTYDGAFAATWQNSAWVRAALAQEPQPEVVVLASHDIPDLSRQQTWETSFYNDGSYDNLTFELAGPNGDGDLYLRFDAPPTLISWDCRPYLNGTNESCTFDPAQQGTYYVMVHAYTATSDASLTITTLQQPSCPDADGDGVCDSNDICPGGDDNADIDGDGVPDFCDACPADNPDDSDGDGVCDSNDICPLDNPDDSDGDGVCDSNDTCPGFDDRVDIDGDGVPDFCDPCPADNPNDSDGDGVCDSSDICPGGDDKLDIDGDGVPNSCDACPADNPNDSDGDGICDSSDICPGGNDNLDIDGDGVPDGCDPCPLDPENDIDSDGFCGDVDNCPTVSNPDQTDDNADGHGDACVSPEANIRPDVTLGFGVEIDPGATIKRGAIIGDFVEVGAGAVVGRSVIVGEGTSIGDGARLNRNAQVGAHGEIGANAVVGLGAKIGDHTQVGPDVLLKKDACLATYVTLGSEVLIGHHANVGPMTEIAERTEVRQRTDIGAECAIGGEPVPVGMEILIRQRVTVLDASDVPNGTEIGSRSTYGAGDLTLGICMP